MFEAAVGCGYTHPFTNDTVVSKLRNTLHIAIRFLAKLSLCPALTLFSRVVVLAGVLSRKSCKN